MDLFSVFLLGVITALMSVIFVCFWLIVTSKKFPEIDIMTEESVYEDSKGESHVFSSLKDPATKTLSVVVPAYNEEERLPAMLDECMEYLKERESSEFTYEVIVVDDGSRDATSEVVKKYSRKYGDDKLKCLKLVKNRGKGGAVRIGMLSCSGKILLFADADGATKFEDFKKLESSIHEMCQGESDIADSLGVVCGSRAHLEEESVAHRSFFRTLLMYGFHALVRLFTVRGVKDTQCGFKLLTRRAARVLFESLHIERWAFDVEMLVIAQTLGFPISEVAVRWTEIDGSKVTPIISWLQMGRDLILIWLRYRLGAWQINTSSLK